MPPDDDVFCISTLAPARKTTAADAGTALASERIDRCIALNNDILCIFFPDSTDGCAAIKFFGFGGQAAGAIFFCRSYFFSLVIRLIRNGQPTIPIILVQTCGTGGVRAVQNILSVQLQLGVAASFYGHTRYSAYRFFFFSVRIGTAVILFDIHITEPDFQHLLSPIVDDPDDVFGGVFDAALCRRISRRGSGGGGISRRGVGLSGLRGRCLRLFRGAESGLGGLLLRIRVCRGVLVHHILLGIFRGIVCGGLRGVLILLGDVLALLILGRVLLGLVQGKACVRVRLALPGSRPGCFQLLRISALLVRDCDLCPLPLNSAVLSLGSAVLVDAVLNHDLVAGVGVGLIPLSYFHILLLAVRTRYGLYVNAAVADIVNIRKGRGCNGCDDRHDGCRRQHPQS